MRLFGKATKGAPRRGALAVAVGVVVLAGTIASAQVFQTLLSFPGGTDGAYPTTNSVVITQGAIFGAASQGGDTTCGSQGCGLVYKLTGNGVETVLYTFKGASAKDGSTPNAPVINPVTQNVEGTTSGGGTNTSACVNGCGTVYALDSAGGETVLHAFSGSPDGNEPLGIPVVTANGNLYGVTFYGGGAPGQTGAGTVFAIDSAGNESIVYRFTASPDGTNPNGSLVRDSAGNLYGTTTYGGSGNCNNGFLPGCGVVFKIDSAGNESVLHSFTGGSAGQYPNSLAMDGSGNLYGSSGYNNQGVIFKIDSSGTFSVLYNSALSISNLVLRSPGGFFLIETGGSRCPDGCVAELLPNGNGYKPRLLRIFSGSDGNEPDTLLLNQGALYGATYVGGAAGYGTVFRITP